MGQKSSNLTMKIADKFCLKLSQGLMALTVILYIGCNSKTETEYAMPNFKEVSSAKVTVLSEELFGLSNILDVFSYRSHIIVIAYNRENNTLLHIFSKTGELVCETLKRGRGPKELNWIYSFWFDQDSGRLQFFDRVLNKTVDINIDRILAEGAVSISETHNQFPGWFTHICPLDDGSREIIIRNIHSEADTTGFVRIEMRDSSGNTIAQHKDFPESDPKKRFIIYGDDMVSVSPDGERMAIGTSWGCVLELYSIKDNLQLENVEYLIKPDFIAHNGYGEMTENTRFGFSDLYTSDSFIYSVLSNKAFSAKKSESRAHNTEKYTIYNNICIFDWESNPIKKISTDFQVRKLCVDEDLNIGYAVVADSFGRPFLGKFHIDI